MFNQFQKEKILKALFLSLIVLLCLLFLTSCNRLSQGENADQTASALARAQTGTSGVEVNFVTNYPPSKIYDINDLVALIEVKNKGNYDLNPGDCFVRLGGFDPNIIRSIDYVQACGDIDGKDVYNLDGGFKQIEYKTTAINLPDNIFEYSPNLNLQLCYKYQTKANPLVCVDPLFYDVTAQQKSCIPKDVGMGGGQGGPVGVSSVGVEMIGGTAMFEISVRNFGSGKVLSPYSAISNCGESNVGYDDLDKVNFDVEMTGGSLVSCTPSDRVLRLSNGAGKIMCSFDINGASAYETPLMISLDYNYMTSISKSLQVVKTP